MFLLHLSFLHCCSCTVRSNVGKRSDVLLYVCIASCCFCLFIRRIAHLDGLFTLSLLHIMYVFLCVFSCGLAPSPASLYISLSFSPSPPFSVWCVLDWEGCQPFFDWSLAASDACWLASFCSPLVMWYALDWLRVICVWTLWCFLHCVQLMNLQLNSPSFPSFFKGSDTMFLDFFLNAFVMKYFIIWFVLCANGCIVCVQNCLTYSPGSLFSMSFSFLKEVHASNTIAAHQQN